MKRRDIADYGYANQQPDNGPDFDQYESGCAEAHEEFCEGMQDVEGVITTHAPSTAPYHMPDGFGAVLSDELDYNPPVMAGIPRRRY